jgi:CTP:molybdopterin cytidylyltransferase MocA
MNAPLQGLVLAAGQGHRFGGGKLHALYRGKPLLSHALAVVRAACDQGLLSGAHVVVAADDELAVKLVRAAGLVPVVNNAPGLGLSHSLRLGLASLETRGATEGGGAMIFLGDQPLVRLEVIEQLAQAWRQGCGTIIRPRYESRGDAPGHPVLVSREMWPRARRLEGDLGFIAALDGSSPDVVTLDIAGDNPDVDTPADLQAIERAHP